MPTIINNRFLLSIIVFVLLHTSCFSQTTYTEEQWYHNPLGFEPLSLHTRNAFIVPAIATAACLLLTEADSTFAKSVSLYTEYGPSWGYKYPYSTVHEANVGFVYSLRSWLDIGVELSMYKADDSFNNTIGLGFRPFARFSFITTESLKVYFESGGGITYFSPYFPLPTDKDPRLGTPWNGTTKYGLGALVSVGNGKLMFGVRHLHVSNGNTSGVERNPSHDSNGFLLGYSYTFQ